jgi:3-dehydroquinate dehydratase-2
MTKSVYIINGPNLNLLGQREPEIYGTTTLDDIRAQCEERAAKNGQTVSFYQSNVEGEMVNLIHEAREKADALIINAGAYTHTSVALLDAVQTLSIPVIEVHISNLFKREAFRHHSYISQAAKGLICGLGPQGYLLALDSLLEH